jgi:LPPG:FO 2-phospho-L-lactate transferase
MPEMTRPITVLCGGVGAARFLRALLAVVDAGDICAVVNTGDDTVLHGLHIAPDLDTVTYTVGGAIDPERGWGLSNETWNAMDALGRYGSVRPSGSTAGGTWFGLGDRDLATHLYRTARLAEGATLTEVSSEIARAWGLGITLLPMSDDPAPTRVGVDPTIDPGPDGDGMIGFQEYFVRHRHGIETRSLDLGARRAQPTDAVITAITEAEVVLIAPSNPLVSIAPIRALPGVDAALAARRDTVAAISPLIGGAALKGPADRMMAEAGLRPDAIGVAEAYTSIARALVIDRVDAAAADSIAAAGMEAVVTDTIMSTPEIAANLAAVTLRAARAAVG